MFIDLSGLAFTVTNLALAGVGAILSVSAFVVSIVIRVVAKKPILEQYAWWVTQAALVPTLIGGGVLCCGEFLSKRVTGKQLDGWIGYEVALIGVAMMAMLICGYFNSLPEQRRIVKKTTGLFGAGVLLLGFLVGVGYSIVQATRPERTPVVLPARPVEMSSDFHDSEYDESLEDPFSS